MSNAKKEDLGETKTIAAGVGFFLIQSKLIEGAKRLIGSIRLNFHLILQQCLQNNTATHLNFFIGIHLSFERKRRVIRAF